MLPPRLKIVEALREQESMFRGLVEKFPLAILINTSLDHKPEYISSCFKRMFGYTSEDMPDLDSWWRLAFPDPTYREEIQARWSRYIELVLRGDQPSDPLEAVITCKDGSTRTVQWGYHSFENKNYSYGQDVTEIRRREEELRRSRAQLSLVLDNTGEAIAFYDMERRLVWANRVHLEAVARAKGHSEGLDALVGHSCIDIWEIDSECENCPVGGCMSTGRVVESCMDFREHVDGPHAGKCLRVRSVPVRDTSGAMIGTISIAVPFSDQMRMEEKIRRTEKLAAVGLLAGGVAHNFNNQLTGILGFADLLLAGTDDPALRGLAEEIKEASMRAARLTGQLLAFARKGNQQNIPVDVNKCVCETVEFLRHTVDYSISIQSELGAFPSMVMGDPSQLHDAILNLSLNARDAMARGGTLRIATACVELDEWQARSRELEPGRYVRVEVVDDGCGMAPETLQKIFEPFFTTKPLGQGTGLGLASAHGTVAAMGGTICVQSEVGVGTTFSLYLPLAAAEAAVSADPPCSAGSIHGRGRILVVDDDELVLQACSKILRHLGYEVKSCRDGASALELYRLDGDSIDLVLLDLMMPGMGGREVLSELRRIDPGVAVVISSGYSLEEARPDLSDGVTAFLQKPFNLSELSQVVAGSLGRQA